MIDCKETLARLYEYLDDELTPEQATLVAEHLELCRPCFDRVEFERTFGRFVKQAGQGTVSSGPLKAKIKSRLAELEAAGEDEELFPNHCDTAPIDRVIPPEATVPNSEAKRMVALYQARGVSLSPSPAGEGESRPAAGADRPRTIPFWSYLLVAAAVVLIAIPLIQQYGSDTGPDPVLQALVALHTDGRPELEESNAAVLADWLAKRTSFKTMVQEMVDVGCNLKGAAVDSVWGTQLVHIFAEADGTPLSMIATSEAEFVMPDDLGVLDIDDERYWTADEAGYSVLIWKLHDRGLVCIAIARMPADRLMKLARDAESRMDTDAA